MNLSTASPWLFLTGGMFIGFMIGLVFHCLVFVTGAFWRSFVGEQ